MTKQRPELNLSQVIAMILQIESDIKVPCLSYGLYDKADKTYITIENKDTCFDYHEAYDNRCKFRYTHDASVKDNAVIYLLKHHGEIYFPMLKRNTQKAYVAQFDVDKLLELYGANCNTTPDQYFKEKFCWETKTAASKSSKQCAGQLSLVFE